MVLNAETHPKNVSPIFRGLRLSLGHLVSKSLKALCLSSKMVHQHLPYLLSFKDYKVQLIFSIGILEGVKGLISQAEYNGPKQR